MEKEYSREFLELCQSVTAKRARTVIDHILKHGSISTEELKSNYGYNHPPRAARDVKEHGIPLERFTITGSDGRKIAAYRFADPSTIRLRKLSGRTGLSKEIKKQLIEQFGCRCFIYLEEVPEREMQIDHRIPYEISGDSDETGHTDFMLLCSSANRAKSWSCEHCENWHSLRKKELCMSCYWAYPENYSHIALRQIRRVDLMWQEDEIGQYDRLKVAAESKQENIPEFVKKIISKVIDATH